ncbi:MAG TPA: polysaccharide biosynthesis/export family protein [Polyangia bacterium]|nr:polysaccharide biosynthesis/export family protein [Polyangia bacterium]
MAAAMAVAIPSVAAISGGGCAGRDSRPAVTAKDLPSAVVSRKDEALDPHLLEAAAGSSDNEAYRVGPGDTLLVAVFNHPELAIATYTGAAGGAVAATNGRTAGLYVDNDGTIQFPLIGTVKVAGKTSDELRLFLEDALSRYVKTPKVTVQILVSGSIRYYLLGQFVTPGIKYADRSMRLLEALSLGGSVILDRASLGSAYVMRGGRRLPVNFRSLIRDGDTRQNIWLRGGDTIVVPDNVSDQAFVFGGAAGGNAHGGPVPFVNGRLDLLQALAQSGIGFRERVQGRMSEVRVIRSEGDRGQFFVVDVERILRGDAGSFALAPGDIVFIPPSGVTSWNEAIQLILPTLQTVSSLLNPFVQIKYLSQ